MPGKAKSFKAAWYLQCSSAQNTPPKMLHNLQEETEVVLYSQHSSQAAPPSGLHVFEMHAVIMPPLVDWFQVLKQAHCAGKAKPLKKPKAGGKDLDEDDIALQKYEFGMQNMISSLPSDFKKQGRIHRSFIAS